MENVKQLINTFWAHLPNNIWRVCFAWYSSHIYTDMKPFQNINYTPEAIVSFSLAVVVKLL